MKRLYLVLAAVLVCALTASCGGTVSEAPANQTVVAMDTAITMTAYGTNGEKALAEAENEIYRLDSLLSRAGESGDISALNQYGSGEVSDETALVINTALDIGTATNGAFDITIAPVMDLWGFFGHNYHVPDSALLEEQLTKVDDANVVIRGNHVSLKNGAAIDLGGIAKGYAADRTAEIFSDNGVTSGLISFGSAIWAIGTRPDGSKWRIGITDPRNDDAHIARLELSDRCIVTSGSYEQVFEENGREYHHIIDPDTGYPADSGLASVSIIGGSATTADGLSTALFVMGLEDAAAYWRADGGFDAIFITEENEVYYTKGLEGCLELTPGTKGTVIE